MTRSYEPVQVRNPSEGHLLPLRPNQDFIVILSESNPEVECNSKFFQLTKTEFRKDSTALHFSQNYNLEHWSLVSRTYLGDISILTENYFGTLCVFLEASDRQKTKLMTVINPVSNYLKMDPQALLEVVVFDDKCGTSSWDCTIFSSSCGLKYEMFEYRRFNPWQMRQWVEPSNQCFPRALLFSNIPPGNDGFYEHHYWFRFDRSSLSNIMQMTPGVYPAGKIVFDTDDIYRFLALGARIKGKHKLLEFHGPPSLPSVRRRHIPRDSIFKQNIYLRKKEDSDLHSHRVIYV